MIEIKHANPEKNAKNISELINLCRRNRWTVLNEYSPKEEAEYLRNMGQREAVFVASIDEKFAGFSGIAPRFAYSERLSHCAEGGTFVCPEFWGRGVGRALWLEGNFPFGRKVGFNHYGHFVPVQNTRAIRHS